MGHSDDAPSWQDLAKVGAVIIVMCLLVVFLIGGLTWIDERGNANDCTKETTNDQ